MNISKIFLACVIALYAMANMQSDVMDLRQINSNGAAEYIEEHMENYCRMNAPRSVVCRFIANIALASVFMLRTSESSYIPPIRRVIIGIERNPKFRPQEARSVVSEDD